MPISVSCPKCRRAFQVKEEFAGRDGKCPVCQTVFPIRAPSAPRPGRARRRYDEDDDLPVLESVEDDDDFEAPPRRRGRSGWEKVAASCGWVSAGTVVLLVGESLLALAFLFRLASDDAGRDGVAFFRSLLILLPALFTAAVIVGAVGRSGSRSAPDRSASSAAGVSQSTGVIAAVTTGIFVLLLLLTLTAGRGGGEIMGLIAVACFAAGVIFWAVSELFFARMLQRAGYVLDAPGLRGWATVALVGFAAVLVLIVVLILLFVTQFPFDQLSGDADVMEAVALMTFLAMLVTTSLYLVPLGIARGAMRSGSGDRDRDRGRPRNWADPDLDDDFDDLPPRRRRG